MNLDGDRGVQCSFDAVPVNVYSIVTTVSGGYYQATGEGVLTVFDPSLGFSTGGGWFYWPDTADPSTEYPGDKTNFGYTMSYNKKGQQVKGNLLVIRHRPDGTIFRLKSNAVDGLALGGEDGFDWASFTGKATYMEPDWADAEGNRTFTVYVEDHADGADRFWVQTNDKDGALVDLSLASPSAANAVVIERGDLTAHATDGASAGSGRKR